jgi:DNA-binding PadR family transcriptional regulator
MVTTKKIHANLTKSLLSPIILDLLNGQPMCGYQIIKTIQEMYGVKFGASTIYPLLNNLDEKNLICHEWDIQSHRPKKMFRLTQQGQNDLTSARLCIRVICQNLCDVNNKIEMTNFKVVFA